MLILMLSMIRGKWAVHFAGSAIALGFAFWRQEIGGKIKVEHIPCPNWSVAHCD